MYGGSYYAGTIVEGNYCDDSRRLPHWMRYEENLNEGIYVYILLRNGDHFESALDPTNVPESYRPYRPKYAGLHIVHNASDQYFTTGRFTPHNVRRDRPTRTGNPSDNRIYVKLKYGTVFRAILNRYTPMKKQPASIVQKDASTSQPYKKIRRE